jgi:hypothetical protein
MEAPPNEPEPIIHARVKRRWKGLGLVLFVAFYSLYFAAHVRLSDSFVYLKNDSLSSSQTAAVFGDLITGFSEEKTVDESLHPLFVILHQPVCQVAILGWERLQQDTNSARKHAVATLTAGAAALTVTLLYQTLLWTGVAMWRAALFACVQGASTMAAVWAAVPEVWVFAGLGLTAMLWAVARGENGRWWEFPLATVYAVGCFFWSVVPALSLVFVIAFRGARWPAWMARLLGALGTAVLVLSLLLMLGKAQEVLYLRVGPAFSQESLVGLVAEGREAMAQTPDGDWLRRVAQTGVFSSVVAPEPTLVSSERQSTGLPRRSVSFQDDRWLQMDFHHAVWGEWTLLLVIGLAGLPVACRHHPAMSTALLAALGFTLVILVWFRPELERALFAGIVVPPLVAVFGLGLEGATRVWRKLAFPLTVLLAVFFAAQATRNWQLVLELDSLLRL